jgi:hypothetical protein
MKCLSLAGLCLAVVLACAAIGATSASAAEYGVCVAHKDGYYTESNCETVAESNGEPDGKGAYEFEAADSCYPMKKGYYTESNCETGKPDHKGSYELAPSPTFTSTSGAVSLVSEPPLSGEVKCSASTDDGQITSPTTGVDVVEFTGCEMLGFPCENTAATGEIDTFPLSTELIEAPAESGKVYNKFFGGVTTSEGTFSAIFACENIGYLRIKGSTAGQITPVNTTSTSFETNLTVGDQQALVTEYSATGTAGTWSGEAASEEIMSIKAVPIIPIIVTVHQAFCGVLAARINALKAQVKKLEEEAETAEKAGNAKKAKELRAESKKVKKKLERDQKLYKVLFCK